MAMVNFKPPTDEELRNQALVFLKENRPKEYRSLKASGELDEMLDLKVAATKRHAESLITSGTFAPQVWSWATRMGILERDPD